MKHIYNVFIVLFISVQASAQVYEAISSGPTFWVEKFETMTPSVSPTGGWMTSTGGFSVQTNPHQFDGVNALSKEIISISPGVDSISTPLITKAGIPLVFNFMIRIYDWSGNVPVSPAVLPPGDTCYFTILKYTGSVVSSRKIADKIYGNMLSGFLGFSSRTYQLYPFIGNSDTMRFEIKVSHGANSNYWYDFDAFQFFVPVGISETGITKQNEFYPNPSQNNLQIRLNAGEELNSISVKNSSGQEVICQTKFEAKETETIDISNLPQGVYFAEIRFKNGTRSAQKFIKN